MPFHLVPPESGNPRIEQVFRRKDGAKPSQGSEGSGRGVTDATEALKVPDQSVFAMYDAAMVRR